jgi:hypothetical protein
MERFLANPPNDYSSTIDHLLVSRQAVSPPSLTLEM